jgi:2-phosphoglycerate kinase
LGIPRNVSTDSVRQALRSLIGPDLSPVLHSSSYSAWRAELLPSERDTVRPKRKRVLRGFLAQVQQLDPAVCAIIDRNVTEATSLVMEGAHLVPGIAPSRETPDAILIKVVMAVADEEDHRRHFGVREGQTFHRRRQQPYLEHFGEIRILQDFVVEQAELEGVPVVEASDFDRAVEKTIEHVLDIMLVEQDGMVGAPREGSA